jgi:hypothetical protein
MILKSGKKTIFYISSTIIGTFVLLLHQCVQTRNIEVSSLSSQPLPHIRFKLFIVRETYPTQL